MHAGPVLISLLVDGRDEASDANSLFHMASLGGQERVREGKKTKKGLSPLWHYCFRAIKLVSETKQAYAQCMRATLQQSPVLTMKFSWTIRWVEFLQC